MAGKKMAKAPKKVNLPGSKKKRGAKVPPVKYPGKRG
jgi:hypothetical protein